MIETNTQIQINVVVDANDIAGNAIKAAKKYLAEVCLRRQEQEKKIKQQKEIEWSLYINQLEN
jgi:hypothetical protein